jgi:hypothetical protein
MRQLRCYAEGVGDRWEAISLDLDLAVQGTSFQAVFADLNKAIAEYVEHVSAMPEPDRSRLLHRRAPFGEQLAFLRWALRAALFGRGDGKTRAEFLVPA